MDVMIAFFEQFSEKLVVAKCLLLLLLLSPLWDSLLQGITKVFN